MDDESEVPANVCLDCKGENKVYNPPLPEDHPHMVEARQVEEIRRKLRMAQGNTPIEE